MVKKYRDCVLTEYTIHQGKMYELRTQFEINRMDLQTVGNDKMLKEGTQMKFDFIGARA